MGTGLTDRVLLNDTTAGLMAAAQPISAGYLPATLTALDAVAAAIGQLQTAGYTPDGVVMNGLDVSNARLLKATTNEYLWPDPDSPVGTTTIWGVPLVISPSMASGIVPRRRVPAEHNPVRPRTVAGRHLLRERRRLREEPRLYPGRAAIRAGDPGAGWLAERYGHLDHRAGAPQIEKGPRPGRGRRPLQKVRNYRLPELRPESEDLFHVNRGQAARFRLPSACHRITH
jgi:hypothetical protein